MAQSGLGIVRGSGAVVLLSRCPCKSLCPYDFYDTEMKEVIRKNWENALKKEIPGDTTTNSEKLECM